MTHDPMPTGKLMTRYRAHRTATWLRRGRTQHRRRMIVAALAVTFVLMCAICVLCALGVKWAPLLWLVACAVGVPLVRAVTIVSGDHDEAPGSNVGSSATDRRYGARSKALDLTGFLMMIPILYLIVGAVLTGGRNVNMAYAGGCMVLTALVIGGFTPVMQLAWNRPDAEEGASAQR